MRSSHVIDVREWVRLFVCQFVEIVMGYVDI